MVMSIIYFDDNNNIKKVSIGEYYFYDNLHNVSLIASSIVNNSYNSPYVENWKYDNGIQKRVNIPLFMMKNYKFIILNQEISAHKTYDEAALTLMKSGGKLLCMPEVSLLIDEIKQFKLQ